MENRDLLTDVRLIRKENEILKITKLLDTNETLKDSNIGVKGLILLNNSQSSTDLNGTVIIDEWHEVKNSNNRPSLSLPSNNKVVE